MTPAEVRKRVADIAQAKGDPEIAHSMQDGLYRELLQAIADGECERPKSCAAEALKVEDIDFPRWMA